MEAGLGRVIASLESLARTGWMLRGVPSCLAESVSSHLFASAIIALEAGFKLKNQGIEIDPYKASSIALVHDLAESMIGDVAKVAGIDKSRAESKAFNALPLSQEIKELFREYEENSSIEASLAHAAEAAATYIRGCRFKSLGFDVSEILESMRSFIKSNAHKPEFKEVIKIINESVLLDECLIEI